MKKKLELHLQAFYNILRGQINLMFPMIYANATILGGETVLGADSIIGGDLWLTDSVPPGTRVMVNRPNLVYLKK